jgi:hypothetical protein
MRATPCISDFSRPSLKVEAKKVSIQLPVALLRPISLITWTVDAITVLAAELVVPIVVIVRVVFTTVPRKVTDNLR